MHLAKVFCMNHTIKKWKTLFYYCFYFLWLLITLKNPCSMILFLMTSYGVQLQQHTKYFCFIRIEILTLRCQIEGAWNEDGKGENIWDVWTKVPGNVLDGSTGEVACDSYHQYEADIELLKQLGVNSYRFSISWARVIPKGTGDPNPLGIAYYQDLIYKLSKLEQF